jgi:Flp pilus assembly pilin Flp
MSKKIRGNITSLFKAERGAAAVEFALILPILILLLFGIVEFSRGFNAYLSVTHAAREGARLASIGKFERSIVEKRAYPLKPSDGLQVIGPIYPDGTRRGSPVEIEVIYPFRLSIPLFGKRTITISSKAVASIE